MNHTKNMRVFQNQSFIFLMVVLLSSLLSASPSFSQTCSFASAAKTFAVGDDVFDLVRGDFNEDGFEDLAVSIENGSQDNRITIFLGTETDDLVNAGYYPVSGTNWHLQAIDMNGDGHEDLVACGNERNAMTVLLGMGDGTFGGPVYSFLTKQGISDFCVADFNNDSHPDVILETLHCIALYLGRGDGTFKPGRVWFSPFMRFVSYTPMDANHDGNLDLTVKSVGGYKKIGILYGNGYGAFEFQPIWAYESQALIVAVLDDFDLDTCVDLVIISDESLFYFQGDDSKEFELIEEASLGMHIGDVKVHDYNLDSYPDLLLMSRFYGYGVVGMYANDPDGTFFPIRYYGVGHWPMALEMIQFNEDRLPDLAVLDYLRGVLILIPQLPVGIYDAPEAFLTSYSPHNIASADFNNDQIVDLAVSPYYGNLVMLYGLGNGDFESYTYPNLDGYDMNGHDYNNDGYIDLAFLEFYTNQFQIYLGNYNYEFRLKYTYQLNGMSLDTGHFNNDSFADIAVVNSTYQQLFIFSGRGNGEFEVINVYDLNDRCEKVKVIDLNSDQFQDIVTANYFNESVSAFIAKGDGSFENPIITPLGGHPSDLVTGDFNGDGTTDLTVFGFGAKVLINDGSGNFSAMPGLLYRPYESGTSLNLNDDQYDDLVLYADYYATFGTLDSYLSNGSYLNFFESIPGPRMELVNADFNEDGHSDLAGIDTDSFVWIYPARCE